VTARADRTVALALGAAVALFLTICAAMNVAGWSVGAVESSAHRVIAGPVKELRIDAGTGDITLMPARDGQVSIDSHAEGTLHTPRLAVDVNGSDVSVTGGCSEFTFGHCRSDLLVRIPEGTAVRVDASSGDLAADGLSGDVELRTSSGDVVARGLSGTVMLKSASGDVDGLDLGARAVSARTSSGDATLTFTSPPSAAEAWTASGDATIEVPPGPAEYRVDVETDSGDRQVGVDTSESSAHVLRAHTNSGDAIVGYRP
jgi:DUF4097 and DUF4098 domain-containing protein YvlB